MNKYHIDPLIEVRGCHVQVLCRQSLVPCVTGSAVWVYASKVPVAVVIDIASGEREVFFLSSDDSDRSDIESVLSELA